MIRATIQEYIEKKQVENGEEYDWKDPRDMRRLYDDLNMDGGLPFSFDGMTSVVPSGYEQVAVMWYCDELGATIILEHSTGEEFENMEEFILNLEGLEGELEGMQKKVAGLKKA